MGFSRAIWDLENDPRGNVRHIADNDVTPEEVEEVLANTFRVEQSRSTGRPIAFGETREGRVIAVLYDVIDDDTVYPVTAYEVED